METKSKIKPGMLVKLKWDHPMSIFAKTVVVNQPQFLKMVDFSALDMDYCPTEGEPTLLHFVDAIRHEECVKYSQTNEPILYIGSIVLPPDKEKLKHAKNPDEPSIICKFLWGKKKIYTVIGGYKSSKLEDYFYPVQSSKDYHKKPDSNED